MQFVEDVLDSVDCPGLDVVVDDLGVQVITLNRPEKLNSFTREMYTALPKLLKAAAVDPKIKVTIITGQGRYYSTGNDLSNFTKVDMSNLAPFAKEARDELEVFVNAWIDYPKPILAAVNGPTMGISCTTLALCDAVFASDRYVCS